MEMENKETTTRFRKPANRYVIALILLIIICVALLIAVIVLAVKKSSSDPQTCTGNGGIINLSEPKEPSVFHDLTTKEMKGLTQYLYSEMSLNLVNPANAPVNSSFVYAAELYLPPKTDVLEYLDDKGKKPEREAIVTIFRGDKAQPVVQEIIVGPLPVPTKHRIKQTIPFVYRPVNIPEYVGALVYVTETVNSVAGNILFEIYHGKLLNCGDKCLAFKNFAPMSTGIIGEKSRKAWYWLTRYVEYYGLHYLDFAILVKLDGPIFTIENVWYNGHTFNTIRDFVSGYNAVNITKQRDGFPSQSLFSKLTRREPSFPSTPLRNPVQIEPDGKRYSIDGRHVKYMNWEFDFRMSTFSGPQIYDIRYRNERIVYELSLQEIAVFYSASKPFQKFNNFFDSFGLIGWTAKTLVPGSDCPTQATFIDGLHYKEPAKEGIPVKHQFCLFEHNTGEPLRRHHAAYKDDGSFYEGMENVVLVLRTIFVIANYDYIVNFIFFQNGAMQVKITPTGYVIVSEHSESEREYGFQLHDKIDGNLHLHLFSVKLDMDIKGGSNRYETLDISLDEVPNEFSNDPNARHYQTKFKRNLKSNESEGAYKYNFDIPRYHLFYNDKEKNKYGNPKAYRVHLNGMAKQLIPEGIGNEPTAAWARYQLAVTKLKDNERSSSSVYAMFDALDPVVKFNEYIDDNESIIDQDLVAWITMGTHHIPHTEDLPVTHSPGMELSFYLLPYNYFPEDPSMASRNAIRIEPLDRKNFYAGLRIEKYGVPDGVQCVPKENKFLDEVKYKSYIMFS